MPDRSSHWAELLTPELTEAFFIGYSDGGRRQSLIPRLFNVQGSSRRDEIHQGVGVLGSDGWNFEDSGRVQYDQANKGYEKTFTHAEFAKGIVVERKLIDDNLTNIAFDRADRLGDSAYRKREKGGASVFNSAFSTGTNDDGQAITGPDAVSLCSDSHPYSQDDASTQDNKGTTALSKAAVADTRVAMMKFKDDRGDIMDVMPDEIIVPPELEDTLLEITKSLQDPTSANNAINPQQGRFNGLVWHYLTDTNNWFMTESSRRRRSLVWYDRIPLEFAREEDFDTLQAKFRGYMRYSYGWRDWSWIYGHSVT